VELTLRLIPSFLILTERSQVLTIYAKLLNINNPSMPQNTNVFFELGVYPAKNHDEQIMR
jgi:hypothetical protein